MRTRFRYGRNVGISDYEFKTTMMNMLRAIMEKINNMQEQMGNLSREIEILRKYQVSHNDSTIIIFEKCHQCFFFLC